MWCGCRAEGAGSWRTVCAEGPWGRSKRLGRTRPEQSGRSHAAAQAQRFPRRARGGGRRRLSGRCCLGLSPVADRLAVPSLTGLQPSVSRRSGSGLDDSLSAREGYSTGGYHESSGLNAIGEGTAPGHRTRKLVCVPGEGSRSLNMSGFSVDACGIRE
jgi:hypothetical protein